ncbi:MAG TPA: universal stress protein [Anaerovoracaceae bacterium]|nr:universal stress protein [Anaerovoracaceae bacterium]
MKTILVPIDGSDYSERALLKAKELADQFNSKIILLHVMSIMTTIPYYPNPRFAQSSATIDWPELIKEAQEKAEVLLEDSKKLLGDLEVETVILDDPTSRFANAIVDYSEENNVDLIVMGSNGLGSLRRRLYLGSVTTKVLHMTKNTVMVVQ